MSTTAFILFVRKHRVVRDWSLAELSRRAGLTQPEVSRIESGARLPTLRHVKGLSEAFHATQADDMTWGYPDWVAKLVDLGERARIDARSGPGRWAKREVKPSAECHTE